MSERPAHAAIDWATVYLVWAGEGQHSDEKTAQLLGIPRRTIAWHRQKERWEDRYVAEAMGLSEQHVAIARIKLRAIAMAGMARLRSIILDKVPVMDLLGQPVLDANGDPVMKWRASDRDAVNAMRIVTQYTLDPARDRDIAAPLPASYRVLPAEDETLSPADQAIRILEANVASVNTRILRRGRRV